MEGVYKACVGQSTRSFGLCSTNVRTRLRQLWELQLPLLAQLPRPTAAFLVFSMQLEYQLVVVHRARIALFFCCLHSHQIASQMITSAPIARTEPGAAYHTVSIQSRTAKNILVTKLTFKSAGNMPE
jgi:hypothetical protein